MFRIRSKGLKNAIEMAKGRWLLAVALGLVQGFLFRAYTQPTNDFNEILQLPMYYSEINPESPVGIFSLDLPFYFPSSKPARNQFSMSFLMGNTWHPEARMYYPQDLTPEQRTEVRGISMTNRPDYFEEMGIGTKVKRFQSDGVLEHLKFSYLTSWTKKNSKTKS